jgi:hypothetical protein
MQCPNCSNEIPEGKRFCGHCGHRLAPGPAPDAFDDSAPTQLASGPTPDAFDDSAPTQLATPEPVQEFRPASMPQAAQASAPPEIQAPTLTPPSAETSKPKGGLPGWAWALGGALLALTIVAIIVVVVINSSQPASPASRTKPTSRPAAATNPTSRPTATSKPAATAKPSEPTPVPESSWETFGDSFDLTTKEEAGLAMGEGDFYLSFDARQNSGFDPVTLDIFSEYSGVDIIEAIIWFETGHYLVIYEAWEEEGDSSSINAGFGTWNHVEVVGEDDVLSIYFNGSRLVALDRPTSEVTTEVQFITWNASTAEVRNVYVEGR